MRVLRVFPLLIATALALTAAAHAAETGSVSGVVKDSQGGVLPGVVVKVSGDLLPAGREATTTATGTYVFGRLLPGLYKVEATTSGMGTAARQARVYVDVDTQVELVLNPTAAEAVTVVADVGAVDLKSTEVNFNYRSEQFQELPLSRSYNGLFQLIPGVADNRTAGGISAGGSRQDNTYLMDGVNITNPGFGYLSTEVNELDIGEFNVKRGAVSAEFGRTAGVVTNAVSKSGTNTFGGAARVEWMPKDFVAGFRDNVFREDVPSLINPAIGLGGPIVKDKFFWYASGRYFENVTSGALNNQGTPLPDSKTKGHELYGKVTATPSPKHLLAVSYRDRPSDTSNSGLGADTSPAVGDTVNSGSRVATASWSYFPTDKTVLDVKYLYLFEKNEGVPITPLAKTPAPFDPNNLAAMGLYFDPNLNLYVGGSEFANRDNFTRHQARAQVSQYFDVGKTGHQLKAGLGWEWSEEDLLRTTNGWGTIISSSFGGKKAFRARYYPDQPPQLGQATTWSIFVQDTMTIGQRFSLNAGILLNRDDYAQDLTGSGGCPTSYTPGGAGVYESSGDKCTFLRFGFGDEVQPRIGLNYNVRPGRGDKVYANWGRYYNLDQKSSTRSLAPRRIYQNQAYFDAVTGALLADAPRASTTGKLIDPAIKPTYNDEYLAGYATPMSRNWAIDVYYQYRNTKNFIEDVPSSLPDNGPYVAANLPCTSLEACQGADAKRKYQAFTVEVSRKMANRWSLLASYTWSKLEGNIDYDYDFEIFNTSSFIQDGPTVFVQDPYRYGPLTQDRPSVFKAFATWEPIDRLTVGGYLRVQSGTPWNTRAADFECGGSCSFNYLEQAGSHRNPVWTNFDLLASYRLPVGHKQALTIEGRFLNLFNTQTQLSTDGRKYLDANYLDAPPWVDYTDIPVNQYYGQASGYAPPFRFVISARFDF
jgi:carboxypeptidase family protein